MAYNVKNVADLAGISVRALHHYDEIGLLKPASLSPSGYRKYTESDLMRLQEILFFRELGFGLKEIKQIIDSPGFDRKEALLTHKQLLLEKQHRLQALLQSVDRSIEAIEKGNKMKKEDMFEGFDDSKMKEYQEEAKARWGETDAYKESERRTSRYTKEDWKEIQAEAGEIIQKLADLMDRAPGAPEVQAQIDRWYRHINERYYTCPLEIFRCLGEGYVADHRFTEFYDKIKPGLAAFKRDAMNVYCDAHERREGL